MKLLFNPLESYELSLLSRIEMPLIDLSLTNYVMGLLLPFLVFVLFVFYVLIRKLQNLQFYPGLLQTFIESLYQFLFSGMVEQAGNRSSRYFPFIFSLFLFILGYNLLGLFPYSYSLTSHIIVTFSFSFLVFITNLLLGIYNNGRKFLSFFRPKGIPDELLLLVIVVEVFSFMIRPLSMGIRLFANILAGHILIHIITYATFYVFATAYVFAILPFAFCLAILALELLLGVVQAYVFFLLTCIYLSEFIY